MKEKLNALLQAPIDLIKSAFESPKRLLGVAVGALVVFQLASGNTAVIDMGISKGKEIIEIASGILKENGWVIAVLVAIYVFRK